MNFKKTFFFLAAGIVSIVLLYNFIISPMIAQNNYSWGMGMHMGEMHSSNMNSNFLISTGSLSIIALILIGLVIAAFFIFRNQDSRCPRCGYEIKDSNWKVCPVCGAKIKSSGGQQG